MDKRAWAIFLVGVYGDSDDAAFGLMECSGNFDEDLAVYVEENPPRAGDGSALAKFYADDLPEGPYDLAPMEGSEYTHAYFWRDDSGGIVTIKGRYW